MNSLPENEPRQSQDWPQNEPKAQSGPDDRPQAPGAPVESHLLEAAPVESAAPAPSDSLFLPFEPLPPEPPSIPPAQQQAPLPDAQPLLFQSWFAPPPPPLVRIPNFGHLCLLVLLGAFGLLGAGAVMRIAMHYRLFGVSTVQQAVTEIHYTLGTEAALYLFTFAACLIVFPLVWHKSFFAGVQWNGATAFRLRKRLLSAAFVCFLFALLNGLTMPGPTNAPIERIFRAPGAPWLLFAFGVTLAPFFEETFFRGFLLPAFCTAYDWIAEKTTGAPMRPLAANGHPQWSFSAMVAASVATSIPFAWMHAAQTGYSLGPFFLLVGVSLVLCGVRLWTRSLAASVMVHASYNFLLFSLMLLGTDGFRHLSRM
jgi:membrane protease YdiL (CAAX protease family)